MTNNNDRNIPQTRQDAQTAADPAAAGKTAPAPRDTSLQVFVSKFLKSLQDLKTRSLEHPVLHEFAEKIGNGTLLEWRIAFELARWLKGLTKGMAGDVSELKPVVDEFHRSLSASASITISAGELWIKFIKHWGNIHTARGSDPLTEAFSRVADNPSPPDFPLLPESEDDDLRWLARVVYEISKERDVFLLKQTAIAEERTKLTGKPKRQPYVSGLIALLCEPACGILVKIYQGTAAGDGNKYRAGPKILDLREKSAQLTLVIDNTTKSTAVRGGGKKYEHLGKK